MKVWKLLMLKVWHQANNCQLTLCESTKHQRHEHRVHLSTSSPPVKCNSLIRDVVVKTGLCKDVGTTDTDSHFLASWSPIPSTLFCCRNILYWSFYRDVHRTKVQIWISEQQQPTNKRVLHGLCSPPTGKVVLLQAIQIHLLSLRYERRVFIDRPPLRGDRRYPRGGRSSPRWSSVCPVVRKQCFTMSSLRARANYSVVGCKNQRV